MIVNRHDELIGNTPMIRLDKYRKHLNLKANIIAKLEGQNPLNSVKDRLAFALIEDLEQKKLIHKETIIIEPSSGNTGIGMAFVCAARGYKLIIVGPESMTKERITIMRALGAEVILTPQEKGMRGAIEKVETMIKENTNFVTPRQFENPANPAIHRRTTAVEIWDDLEGNIDYFVAGVGTGGTLTGVGEFLKDKRSTIQVVAVEPNDSPVLSGGEPGPHKIQGIGAGFIPPILNQKIIDQIIRVDLESAYEKARMVAKLEGVFIGVSSGAALHAATELASRSENAGKNIVVVFPSAGERYLSTPLFEEEAT